MNATARVLAIAGALLSALACGDGSKPEASASAPANPPTPTPASAKPAKLDRSAPASKRILGRYLMSLNQVPSAQLNQQLAEAKRQGKIDQMARVEYTVTETQFLVETYGALGRKSDSFTYEILSENGDELKLRKHGAATNDGRPLEVKVLVLPDEIYLNADMPDRVRLQRIE